MRFNSEAYDKAFPRTRPKETIETVVETFRPTQQDETTEEVVTESEKSDDGNGSNSESDLE